jgi:hypothetical protein
MTKTSPVIYFERLNLVAQNAAKAILYQIGCEKKIIKSFSVLNTQKLAGSFSLCALNTLGGQHTRIQRVWRGVQYRLR